MKKKDNNPSFTLSNEFVIFFVNEIAIKIAIIKISILIDNVIEKNSIMC